MTNTEVQLGSGRDGTQPDFFYALVSVAKDEEKYDKNQKNP